MEEAGKEHNSCKRLRAAVGGDGDSAAAAWRTNRVARAAAGGKDRHSKVVTSRGLRDRRIRLSVPTAVQFYDIQDRLGVDQPSKAIEWLVRAAAAAIDALPSLDCSFLSPTTAASPPHDDTAEVSTSETSKGSVLSLANGPSDNGSAATHHANAYNGGGGSGTFAELLHCSAAADKPMQQQPTLAYYATPQSLPLSFEMFPQLAFSQEQQHHHHHAAVAFDRSTLQSNAVAVPMWPPSQYPFMMQRFPVAPSEASPTFPFFLGSGASATAPATSSAPERRLQLWDFKEERKT